MEKQVIDGCVDVAKEYLDGIGKSLSSVQLHELTARILGFKNRHVMAGTSTGSKARGKAQAKGGAKGTLGDSYVVKGKTYPIRKLGQELYTVPELQAIEFDIAAIMAVPLEMFRGGDSDEGPDAMNDYVSEKLTGDAAALCDIGYTHIPELNYGEGYAAVLVTGGILDPEDVFDELVSETDRVFYENLGELVQLIQVGQKVTMQILFHGGPEKGPQVKTGEIAGVNDDCLALLRQYAATQGDNNDAVNAEKNTEVFAVVFENQSEALLPKLNGLKYATKNEARIWTIADGDVLIRMHFPIR